jgi:hypothetical protein
VNQKFSASLKRYLTDQKILQLKEKISECQKCKKESITSSFARGSKCADDKCLYYIAFKFARYTFDKNIEFIKAAMEQFLDTRKNNSVSLAEFESFLNAFGSFKGNSFQDMMLTFATSLIDLRYENDTEDCKAKNVSNPQQSLVKFKTINYTNLSEKKVDHQQTIDSTSECNALTADNMIQLNVTTHPSTPERSEQLSVTIANDSTSSSNTEQSIVHEDQNLVKTAFPTLKRGPSTLKSEELPHINPAPSVAKAFPKLKISGLSKLSGNIAANPSIKIQASATEECAIIATNRLPLPFSKGKVQQLVPTSSKVSTTNSAADFNAFTPHLHSWFFCRRTNAAEAYTIFKANKCYEQNGSST